MLMTDGDGHRTTVVKHVERVDHLKGSEYDLCVKFTCDDGREFFLDLHRSEVERFMASLKIDDDNHDDETTFS